MTRTAPDRQATEVARSSKRGNNSSSGSHPTRLVPKLILTTAMVCAAAGGVALARVAPITAFDWLGLLQGRKASEVLVEGLGRKLTAPYQILVMGIDRVPDVPPSSPESFNGRSDTMLLVRLDPGQKAGDRRIEMLAIPRDTLVYLSQGTAKINAANVYGGSELAVSVVSETLQNARIDRYVRVDTSGLIALVDALGGIDVDVPKRMVYEDKTQKLHIDLYPGKQHLNGRQAEGFARFRHDEEGDIGRIKRQQILLKAVKARMNDAGILLELPRLVQVLQNHIDSNLSFDEMLAFATFSLNVKPNQIRMTSLPGRPSEDWEYRSSYWITDPGEVEQAIAGRFKLRSDPEREPQP